MKYIIYLTINKVNGKAYVGVHKTKDPYIFDGYIGNGIRIRKTNKKFYNPQTAFQKAYNKYGQQSFTRHTLFVFDLESEAYKMEATIVNLAWIKSNKTYNTALGGGSGAGPHSMDNITINLKQAKTKIYQYSLKGDFLKEWDSLNEASKYLGKESRTSPISLCAQGSRNKAYGYQWRYSKVTNLNLEVATSYEKKLYQYSIQGNFIKEWDSIQQAASVYGKSLQGNMSAHIRGDRKSLAGFIWTFKLQ